MIIIRVPVRVPLGGGGTDLPRYCHQYGGHLITASINKYIYITINQPVTLDRIKLFYSHIEEVDNITDIKHNIIRECLKYLNIEFPIEINTSADLAGSSGMGSSSAFTVGLLLGLTHLIGVKMTKTELAELASKIEIDILKSPIGKQDQYASALGGVNELLIDTSNHVTAFDVKFDYNKFENSLLMFYTNTQRNANEILQEVNDSDVTDALHVIKSIGCTIKQALKDGDVQLFGELLHRHWIVKRKMTPKMTTGFINECYEKALQNGVIGGKIMGAGGGGFLLLCCKVENRNRLINAMSEDMKYMDFNFEFEGAKIIYHD